MIVDENLNDISDEVISTLEESYYNMKRWNTFYKWLLIIFAVGMIILNYLEHHYKEATETLSAKIEQEEQMLSLEYSIGYWFINQPEQINDSILYVFLKDNNAWYPEILLKQAKLESGNYLSDVYINANNLYGMKKVGKRQTTQLNTTYKGYGCYTNWCESVLDRMLWDVNRFNNIKPTEEEYLEAMSIYAETENYAELLN